MMLDLASGFEELFNHLNLGSESLLVVAGSTTCCATGTCDNAPPLC